MVKTLPVYNPANPPDLLNDQYKHASSLIRFAVRVLDRKGEVVIDFGELKDILAYSDHLDVGDPSGSFRLEMEASTSNSELFYRLHPGMVIEVYCARNADPTEGLELTESDLFANRRRDRIIIEESVAGSSEPQQVLDPDFTPVVSEPDYLDRSPYLLLRGIIKQYGLALGISGSGASTSLVISGNAYGQIYQDSLVLLDQFVPQTLGKALQTRMNIQTTGYGQAAYYAVLQHFVEEFWEEPTGWEARTRLIPVFPEVLVRLGPEQSVWSAVKSLCAEHLFQMFADHTGAICWEKMPYSSRENPIRIDDYLLANQDSQRNWEDLPLYPLPKWKILRWSARLATSGVSNYMRCEIGNIGGTDLSATQSYAAQIYNQASINQYGVSKRVIRVPYQLGTGAVNKPDADLQFGRIDTFADIALLEAIRWYDRPHEKAVTVVRGEPYWRINTRVEISTKGHPLAQYDPNDLEPPKPAQYYVIARSHEIRFGQESYWKTQLDLSRDRRKRYLGIGNPTDTPETVVDFEYESDRYFFFDRYEAFKIREFKTLQEAFDLVRSRGVQTF